MTDPSPTADDVAARRAAWLAALRSGDYAQATGALRVEDGYCCLGVAEDVRGATWLPVDRSEDREHDVVLDHTGTHQLYVTGQDRLEGIALTPAGMRWYGLTTPTPHVVLRDRDDGDRWVVATLPELNDDWGLTLAVIADVIEAQAPDWTGDRTEAEAEAARRNDAPGTGS